VWGWIIQVRFDVVRARKCHIAVEGTAPCAEYSWFPGQAWRMAACVSCHTHLGWHFQPAPRSDAAHGVGGEVGDDASDATPTRESRVGSKRTRVASPSSSTSPPQDQPPPGELDQDTAAATTSAATTSAAATTEAASPSSQSATHAEDTSQHFTGLIVTRLREKRVTRSELEQVRSILPPHPACVCQRATTTRTSEPQRTQSTEGKRVGERC
jgi:hypothetical protein